jgi:hypothetical protein
MNEEGERLGRCFLEILFYEVFAKQEKEKTLCYITTYMYMCICICTCTCIWIALSLNAPSLPLLASSCSTLPPQTAPRLPLLSPPLLPFSRALAFKHPAPARSHPPLPASIPFRLPLTLTFSPFPFPFVFPFLPLIQKRNHLQVPCKGG